MDATSEIFSRKLIENDPISKICSRLYFKVENYGRAWLSNLTNADRVKIVTDRLKKECLLPSEKILKTKSQEKSLELRNLGNRAFLKKDYKVASVLYTKSIAAAPFPTGELDKCENALALAFANRSAVLFHTDKYELCLNDLTEALKYNYPERLIFKLYERQGKCQHYLGRKKEAVQSIQNALKWLPSAEGLTQDKKKVIELKLQELLKCFESTKTSPKCSNVEQPPLPKCSYNRNKKMPCASDCVEVKYSAEMGCYVSATRDIQPGDVLVVEKPFASFLSPEHFETHCFNCLQYSEVLIPCCSCSNVMYCSEECRTSSWNKNHFTDCSLLPTLQKLDISVAKLLALKIVIMICKNKDFKSIIASLEAEKNLEKVNRGFSKESLYSASGYGPIYWLVDHTEKRDHYDLLRKTVTAACILHCLETMTDFFSDVDIELKYEVGGLLLRHLQSMPCNSHAVKELIEINAYPVGGVAEWEDVILGAGAYSVLSLFNHSCYPNSCGQR